MLLLMGHRYTSRFGLPFLLMWQQDINQPGLLSLAKAYKIGDIAHWHDCPRWALMRSRKYFIPPWQGFCKQETITFISLRKCHISRPFRLLHCKRPSSSLHTSHSVVLKLVEDAVSSINRAFFSLKYFSSLPFHIPFSFFIFQPNSYLFNRVFFDNLLFNFPKTCNSVGWFLSYLPDLWKRTLRTFYSLQFTY